MEKKKLSEIIKFNSSFKTAINLYLSLNKKEKILNYIPTKSSVLFMDGYIRSVLENKEHATLLIGPYGKGKSYLLLVLLSLLSMERTEENEKTVKQLKNKISSVEEIGKKVTSDIEKVWEKDRFLPVIVNVTNGDLNQALLVALNDALKRDGIEDLSPETAFSEAIKRIEEWETVFPDTYIEFQEELKKNKMNITEFKVDLIPGYSPNALKIFKEIYPKITAGSVFNPLAASNVQELYKSVSDKLAEDYGYSGIYVVFDEFSKFIERLDGSNAGDTMKLIQDMCELANESANAQIYMTMVAHKSIKEYGKYLSAEIINAFTGIEGRIVEKFFITSSKNNYELIRNAIVKDVHGLNQVPQIQRYMNGDAREKYYELPAFRSNFEREDFENIIFEGCYPLNPITAYLLLNVSEKVAQNERTLFTFISNDEPHSMARFVAEHDETKAWTINADLIYDYFCGLFKKDVSNELVHNIWLSAEYALTKCASEEERKVIKALAIIMIVNKHDEIPANEKYLTLAGSLEDGAAIINTLVDKQIIYKKSSIGAYVFKTRAGSELKAELKKQRAIKDDLKVNYANVLQQITGKYYIVPRKYNVETMMTRYFVHEFLDVNSFLSIDSADAFFERNGLGDGKLITLYSFDEARHDEVKVHFKKLNCRKLALVVPKKIITGRKALKDYEILQEIRKNQTFLNNNEVLKKEIPLLEEDIVKEIEDNSFDTYADASVFYWEGNEVVETSAERAEQVVGLCCQHVYTKTPVINNEMINRRVVSTAPTRKSRLSIIEAIISHKDDEVFYSGTNQEATMYRSLFERTGIVKNEPSRSISAVLDLMNEFIDSCCDQKRGIYQLIQELISEPFGMRLGVIPAYLAYVFSRRHEDIIIYFSDMEVQLTAEIIVNMCEHPEAYSMLVSKADYVKENYIKQLNGLFLIDDKRALSDNRIKNIVICMQRWYRGLPQISRNIAGISAYGTDDKLCSDMKALRKIMQKVEVNPYEVLFVDLMKAFSVDDLIETYKCIENCKKAFDGYYDWAVERTVNAIYEVFGGRRKLDLYHTLKEWHKKQSDYSKKGLHSSGVTNLMSCIDRLDVNTDSEDGTVTLKVVKAVTSVYLENWMDNAYEEFVEALSAIKTEIEHIKEDKAEGKLFLSFTGTNGEPIEHYYEKVDEGTGAILRNIIEDTLEEYDDLSVNDRVGILLEMIEKIIGRN